MDDLETKSEDGDTVSELPPPITTKRRVYRQQSLGGSNFNSSFLRSDGSYKNQIDGKARATPRAAATPGGRVRQTLRPMSTEKSKKILNPELYGEEGERIAEEVYQSFMLSTNYISQLKDAFREVIDSNEEACTWSAERMWKEAKHKVQQIPEPIKLELIKKVQKIDTHSLEDDDDDEG